MVELYSRDHNNEKIEGVHGTPMEGEFECMWVGAGGEMENLPIKLMFQFIFQITCLSL